MVNDENWQSNLLGGDLKNKQGIAGTAKTNGPTCDNMCHLKDMMIIAFQNANSITSVLYYTSRGTLKQVVLILILLEADNKTLLQKQKVLHND